MRTITNDFKDALKEFGRQIDPKLIYYPSYDIITEDNNNIITETGLQLISEQSNFAEPTRIDNENIASINIIKNGNLLQSLMKQLNFETTEELNIGSVVNPQFGLLIDEENEEYEYVDYGHYIIHSKEYNFDTETWSYICYDKMLFSMRKYKPLPDSLFPMTLREYLKTLANKVWLEFSTDSFVNQNEIVSEDYYKNKGLTYRDIFDDISKIVAGNLMIDYDDILKVGYPNETNDTIDEEYLKDNNIKFGDKIGVINSISIVDEENEAEYIKEDEQSIKENELTRIMINDNPLILNGNINTIATNIFNKLFGLYYYSNDFSTTGVCYYDFLDLFNVEFKGNSYKCLLLNNEITMNQGIEEQIFTEKIENMQTDFNNYETSTPTNKKVQYKLNNQQIEIKNKVEKNDVIETINQSDEQIEISSDKISLKDKTLNLTDDNISINSNNLKLDRYGNLIANNSKISGNFKTYDENGNLAIEIDNGTIYFYDFIQSGIVSGYIAPINDENNISGLGFYVNEGSQIIIGYKNNDNDNLINAVLSYDTNDTTTTPWIKNTANGTLFPNAGGVEVENGLIKNWNLQGATGTLNLKDSNGNDVALEIKNGIITSWN